jgi:hypothetical protein
MLTVSGSHLGRDCHCVAGCLLLHTFLNTAVESARCLRSFALRYTIDAKMYIVSNIVTGWRILVQIQHNMVTCLYSTGIYKVTSHKMAKLTDFVSWTGKKIAFVKVSLPYFNLVLFILDWVLNTPLEGGTKSILWIKLWVSYDPTYENSTGLFALMLPSENYTIPFSAREGAHPPPAPSLTPWPLAAWSVATPCIR